MYLEQKLDTILKKLEKQEQMMQLFVPDLSKKKEVMHFLQITRQTMDKYLAENRIANGVHYLLDDEENIVYIPGAIIELKQSGIKYKGNRNTKQSKTKNILADMGMVA